MTHHIHKHSHQHNRNFLIKYLISVAKADNNFTDSEKQHIFKQGATLGMTEQEIEKIMTNPSSVEFHPPANKEERFENFFAIVKIMLQDGEIHAKERRICTSYAIMIGYPSAKIDNILDKIISGIHKGLSKDEISEELF